MAQAVGTVGQRTPAATEGAQRIPPRPVFLPPADIYETNDAIVVMAEMPGVGPDGVDITLERRVLTIRGRSGANEHTGYQRVYNEYADGDYERVFTLSEAIDRDKIEATLRDGVLHLVCRKQNLQEHEESSLRLRESEKRTAVRVGTGRAGTRGTGADRLLF